MWDLDAIHRRPVAIGITMAMPIPAAMVVQMVMAMQTQW